MRTPEQAFEELLVLGAQTGRVEAFERLAVLWHPRLLRHARRLTGDAEAALDAVQNAWVSIARGLAGLQDPACFGSWALRITTRRCADAIAMRKRTRDHTVALGDAEDPPAPVDPRAGAFDRARDVLRSLGPEQHALLALYYVEGLSVAEIALALDVPTGTVKSRLHHARDQLRANLEV
jgi:RNA polymerase sigma-70 factor (ECF subfamily)